MASLEALCSPRKGLMINDELILSVSAVFEENIYRQNIIRNEDS